MAQQRKKKNNKYRGLPQNLSCPFDKDPSRISYKDVYQLKKFISTRGRIFLPEKNGVSHICQRKLAREIKRARYMALLPFTEYV